MPDIRHATALSSMGAQEGRGRGIRVDFRRTQEDKARLIRNIMLTREGRTLSMPTTYKYPYAEGFNRESQ
jgi:hypothetical protein